MGVALNTHTPRSASFPTDIGNSSYSIKPASGLADTACAPRQCLYGFLIIAIGRYACGECILRGMQLLVSFFCER